MNVSDPALKPFSTYSLGIPNEILEQLNEGIIFVDRNDVIQYANKQFLQLTNYTKDNIEGKNPLDLFKTLDSNNMERVLKLRNSHKPHTYEIELVDSFNSSKWFRISNSPIFDDGDIYKGSFEIFREITDQKLAEILLQESEMRFRNLADASPVMIWMADIENQFYYFNKPLLDFTGKDIKDELGNGLIQDLHEDDQEKFIQLLSNGNENRTPFKVEFRLKKEDGSFRWMLCVGKPRFINDKYVGNIGSCIDINELKEVQQELEEQTLEFKRSNEELEQFAYVASHDLQEPLRMISSYVQIIEKKLHEDERHDLDEFMKYAIDGVGRLQELINDLLNYSRVNRSEDPFVKTDMRKIVESVEANLTHLISNNNVKLQHVNLPKMNVDQTQILRLFQNLVENSIKFRSTDNPIITISAESIDDSYQFSISDNGIGIEPKHFERIFVIFHRLHSRQSYKGTGIGLAICKRIVERHKGRIWVDSEKGKGSTFYFTLKDMQN